MCGFGCLTFLLGTYLLRCGLLYSLYGLDRFLLLTALNGYRLLKVLGQGGLGLRCYRGRHGCRCGSRHGVDLSKLIVGIKVSHVAQHHGHTALSLRHRFAQVKYKQQAHCGSMQKQRPQQRKYIELSVFLHELLLAVGTACGKHHLELVLISYVEHLDNLLVGYGLIGIKGHVHLGFLLRTVYQEIGQLLKHYGHLIIIAERRVVVKVTVYDDAGKRLGRCLLRTLRQQHLDGVGAYHRGCYHKEYQQQEYYVSHGRHTELRRYLVASLKHNSLLKINGKVLNERLHLVGKTFNAGHQIVVCKQCYDTYNQTAYGCNHSLIDTA